MKTRNRFRPHFDTLESRLVLAVAVTQGDFDANGGLDLRIIGDAASQNVVISDLETSIQLSLDANGDGDFTDAGDRNQEVVNGVFETFDIQLGDGSDNFTFNAPASDYDGAVKSLLVDLGKQADTFHFVAVAGLDVINSSITIDVVGGGGADNVSATISTVVNSAVSINFDLQGGADIGGVFLVGNINSGSVVDVHVDLGAKNNNYSLVAGGNSQPTFDNASVTLDVTGGNGPLEIDTVDYFSAARLTGNASLLVKADLGGGNDFMSCRIDMAALDVIDTSLYRFDLNGDEGNDTLQVLNSSAAGPNTDMFGTLEVNLGGGAGQDSITALLGGGGANFNMELDGTFRTRISGGSEDDLIEFTTGTDATSTGNLDVVILGNAGNDQLTYNLRDDGNTNFGPAGFALVDGGFGNDSLTSNTSGAGFDAASLHKRNGVDPTGITPGVTTGDFDGNGTLDIRFVGTDASQNLTIRDDPDAPTPTIKLELDLNNDSDFADPGEFDKLFNGPFETIYIQTLGGNDEVHYVSQSSFDGGTRSLLVDLGKQADFFATSVAGGGISWDNAAVTFEFLGGGGRDDITVNLPSGGVFDSVVSLDFDAGGGSDLVTIIADSAIATASTVDVRAALGTGAVNEFAMNVGNDILQGSTVQVQVTGGNVATEHDEVRCLFERTGATTIPIALLNGSRLFLDASLQAGDDVFAAFYHLGRIDIDAASSARTRIKSGDGNDSLQISRSSVAPPDANTDIFGLWSFDYAAGLGDDVLQLDLTEDFSVPTNAMELDGTLRYRAHAGGGNDFVRLSLGTASVSGGKVDAILQGGLGNDELQLNFVDNGNETFPPAGFVLLDGGLGLDSSVITGSGAGFDAASVRDCNNET